MRVRLPKPVHDGTVSVEATLHARRSVREFASTPLSLQRVSQLLWAAQGVTDREGLRTAPSAGALYPLELVVSAGQVRDLPIGVYRYRAGRHDLARLMERDQRRALAAAAVRQGWMADAPIIIGISAIYARTTKKYGKRGVRYARMEAGHAAQNICLQAAALGLGTTIVGAFDDSRVRTLLGLSADERPLILMPVGRPR